MAHLSEKVKQILSYYESDNPGTKSNIARILMSGKLSGTGYLVILPVDQGFEHGPDQSFAPNPDAYNPLYHIKLAIDAGLSAYAAPLGMLEAVAGSFAGSIPLILKMNSSNMLMPKDASPNQSITSSVSDALRLGCSAVGFTIYPGSPKFFAMTEEIKEIAKEAKKYGLAVVIWSYPRGEEISKLGETSVDIASYAAHMAALLGAHIIKVKPPSSNIEMPANKELFKKYHINIKTKAEAVSHVVRSSFAGRRLIVFSGGASKEFEEIYSDIQAIKEGGGNGSIIGRNTFQRPKEDALKMLDNIISIYLKAA